VLNNGSTKNFYRYSFAGSYNALSRPLRTNTGGTLSTVTGAVVDGINLRIVDRGLDRSLTYPMASLFGSTTTLNATLYQVMNAANLNATGIALVANTSFLRNEDVLYGNEEWDRGMLLVKAYPNPTDGILHVRMDAKSTGDTPFVINIVDLNGKVVYSETTDSNLEWYELSIDLNQFGKGLYLVECVLKNWHYINKMRTYTHLNLKELLLTPFGLKMKVIKKGNALVD